MDDYAIKTLGIPGFVLMQNAAEATFKIVRHHWGRAKRLAVYCGTGNNGGDGYLVAKLAQKAGLEVKVFSVSPVDRLQGDALSAFHSYQETGAAIDEAVGKLSPNADLIIDALLGTGLDRKVSGRYADAIECMNQANTPILAVDIPSGIHANTGYPLGPAVRASRTVTFIGLKQGLFTGQGPDYAGHVHYASLGVPPGVQHSEKPAAELLRFDKSWFPSRRRSAHKGDFGHVLIIGGEKGYSGAVRLAGEAAGRVGAGLLSIATRDCHASFLNLTRPEIMCHGITCREDLEILLHRATVIAIGPGLHASAWAESMLAIACEHKLPMVVDADGLNLLARRPRFRENWILTPHPGEASRLLNISTNEVQQDRYSAVAAIQKQYGGVCVLKGNGTLVYEEGKTIAVCQNGNPGMATGGMGDVLTGVIAALLAQGFDLGDAARIGTDLHSRAGDIVAQACGERGMFASDLMDQLRFLVNP